MKETFDDNSRSGFFAALYQDTETGKYIVAFRGTEAHWNDIWTDFAQGLGISTRQYMLALRLAREADLRFSDNVVFTGHSLGGGLAAAAAISVSGSAFVFNAAGVHPMTIGLNKSINYNRTQIQHYHLTTDLLTLSQSAIPIMPGSTGALISINPNRLQLLLNPLASHGIANVIQSLTSGVMAPPGS